MEDSKVSAVAFHEEKLNFKANLEAFIYKILEKHIASPLYIRLPLFWYQTFCLYPAKNVIVIVSGSVA